MPNILTVLLYYPFILPVLYILTVLLLTNKSVYTQVGTLQETCRPLVCLPAVRLGARRVVHTQNPETPRKPQNPETRPARSETQEEAEAALHSPQLFAIWGAPGTPKA